MDDPVGEVEDPELEDEAVLVELAVGTDVEEPLGRCGTTPFPAVPLAVADENVEEPEAPGRSKDDEEALCWDEPEEA